MRKSLLFGLLAALAATAVVATTVFACTNLIGTFTVSGSGGGTVTATGTDTCTWNTPPNPPTNCTFGMAQTLAGSTSTLHGTGSFDITWTVNPSIAPDLPSAYDVNFVGGEAYDNNATPWKIDCMDGAKGVNRGQTTLDTNPLDSTVGTLTGQTHFSVDPNAKANRAGQESAVCISDSAANFGNEAPIALT
jgi:hypothetical protein